MPVAAILVFALLASCSGGGGGGDGVACGRVEQILESRASMHVVDVEAAKYDHHPPTSGAHFAGRPPRPGVHEDPLPEAVQVQVLEAGMVVLQYDDAIGREGAGALEALAEGRDDVIVTPAATPIDGDRHVAFTAWGFRQRCDEVSAEVVESARSFIRAHVVVAGTGVDPVTSRF